MQFLYKKIFALYKKNQYSILILLFWFFMAIVFYCINDDRFFLDPDDYMRLIRVKILHNNLCDFFNFFCNNVFCDHEIIIPSFQFWYDDVIARSNFPFGCSLHWTKFYDLILLIGGVISQWFLTFFHMIREANFSCNCLITFDSGLHFFANIVGQIFGACLSYLVFDIATTKLKFAKDEAFILSILFFCNIFSYNNYTNQHPDHHGLIMVSFVYLIKTAFDVFEKILSENFSTDNVLSEKLLNKNCSNKNFSITNHIKNRQCTQFFLACIIAIWVSPEILYFIFIVEIIFVFYSLINSRTIHFLYNNSILICIASIAIFAIENSYQNWPTIAYDKISILHIVIFFVNCIALKFAQIMFSVVKKVNLRIIFLAIIGAISILFVYYFNPNVIHFMSGAILPEVKNCWLDRVQEMQSPFLLDIKYHFSYYVLIYLASIFCVIYKFTMDYAKLEKSGISIENFYQINKDDKARLLIDKYFYVLFLSIVIIIYIILGSFSTRNIHYTNIGYLLVFHALNLLKVGDFLKNSCNFFKKVHFKIKKSDAKKRYCFYFLILLMPYVLFFTKYLAKTEEKNVISIIDVQKKDDNLLKVYKFLDDLSNLPKTFFMNISQGPEFLYFTKHNIVGASYHRQAEGIIADYKLMYEDLSNDEAFQIIKTHKIDYIFIPKMTFLCENSSFILKITKKILPDWLKEIKIPFDNYLLFEIIKQRA